MFYKYVKIKRLGHKDNKDIFTTDNDIIYAESKMDGANTRFGIIDGVLRYGTRNKDLTEEDESVRKPWKEFIDFVESIKNSIPPNYIFYMEYMIPHTIQYDWDKIPRFLGFDVFSLEENKFISPNKAKRMFEKLGIPFVPLVFIDYARNIRGKKIKESMIPKSIYYDGKDEGIIFKNYDKQIFAKIVRSQFKELNESIFRRRKKKKKKAKFDENFIETFATEARIRKIILKLYREKGILDMSLMKDLIVAVWHDIWEEEWQTIMNLNGIYNIRRLRESLIPEKCRLVLEKMIEESKFDFVGDNKNA